jgi:hypothetical protein
MGLGPSVRSAALSRIGRGEPRESLNSNPLSKRIFTLMSNRTLPKKLEFETKPFEELPLPKVTAVVRRGTYKTIDPSELTKGVECQ